MKRFSRRFLRNFTSLLLLLTGIKLWQHGFKLISVLCFIGLFGFVAYLIIRKNKEQD